MSKLCSQQIELPVDQDHLHGTYAELCPSNKSQRILEKIIQQLALDTPTPSAELHCTVTYSRRPCPELGDYRPDIPIGADVLGFRIFSMQNGNRCLVLELHSDDIMDLHKYAMELGCSYDYPDYTPHITLSYNYPYDQVPELDLHDIHLTFDQWNVQPLDPDYVPGE